MKHIYLILTTLFVSLAAVQAQTPTVYARNSVLASGTFVKIKIIESGIYRLTYDDLRAMGVTPEKVRIFGYGGAVIDQNFANPSPDDLPEVAIYDSGSYILFYAQGIVRWNYDSASKLFLHTGNPYALCGYYFVTSDAGTGKKIAVADIEAPVETFPSENWRQITEFTDFQVHEKDVESLIESGKEFYGEKFADQTTYDFSFSFPNAVLSKPTRMRVNFATKASYPSTMSVTLNGETNSVSTPAFSVEGDLFRSSTPTFTNTNTQANPAIRLTYNKPNSTALAYLNWIELSLRRELKMNGTAMRFQNVDYLEQPFFAQYTLSQAGSNVVVWDITDNANIKQMPVQRNGSNLTFTAPTFALRTFLALDPAGSFPKPEVAGNVANQNLHALTNVDLTMIVYPSFWEEAQKLATAHREIDGINVVLTTPEQVYNEFSSGTPDVSAYRKLMRMQYKRDSANHQLKYLLLFGRGSFDNRGLLRTTAGNNLILTYQSDNSIHWTGSYVTDDYVGMMTDNATNAYISNNRIDIATGRFPVTTREQAQAVVNKTVEYMQNANRTKWKNQLVYLADDGQKDNDYDHYMKGSENTINTLLKYDRAYEVNKLYIDAFKQVNTANGETYPEAKAKLASLIKSGILFLNYLGHAGANGLTNEQVLVTDDIKKLSNKNYFLCFAGTCDFMHFDVPKVSAGEILLTNPVGGAIGSLSASRTVYSIQNERLSIQFTAALFQKDSAGRHHSIGAALIQAKNNLIGTSDGNNKLSYVYMGDPVLKLAYPDKLGVLTTEINANTEITGKDTLKALSINSIKGIIINRDSTKAENFNGNIFVSIYDKEQEIRTLANDDYAAGKNFIYIDRPNILYSGKTVVENGEFEINFMMPKDIRYNFGTGRICYYAEMDAENEAHATFENFIIGGSASVQFADTEGPEIEWIYLNSNDFCNGSKVNETPYFVAKVRDEHGINTVGNGIGHDAVLTIDDNPEQAYILNEYYTSDMGGYQSGTFAYMMPELTEGKHSLTFKVWDLLNNSSTAQVEFQVEKGLRPQIFSVSNYPNPATDMVYFHIAHDRPQDVMSVKIEVFDLTGRKMWEFAQNTTDLIRWDLHGSNGVYLSAGMYVYRLTLSTLTGKTSTLSQKIIIKKQ